MRKLGVDSSHRKSMLRNLATDVIIHNKICTTESRAKEARKIVEKLITCAKKNNNLSRQKSLKLMFIKKDKNDNSSFNKLFNELGPKYKDRQGGYTRIIKLDHKKGDGSLKVILELV